MSETVSVLPYGERAVLLQTASVAESLGVYTSVKELGLDGVEDVVPASRTVLVTFTQPALLQTALPALRAIEPDEHEHEDAGEATIEVVYDGEDLADVADMTGMSVDEVIEVHSSTTYTVAFLGFAPGFAYLTGLDERLHMPRRPSPRTKVPRGSVAMAGPFTAVYPHDSPGGWQLLGRSDAPLWDLDRAEPSLLRPGMQVRFQAVDR
ncbi:5-oxoprolinase subunit PxpB [Epidermidibacterium keratini]|uniref:5-oxoprolinase subunit PxpB n=1 Tax=Epidermidibacterium keratini TaxID=1891644 RepID=A0A7L4YPX0_9ACTN|nr:5-oxoprolinase subunit PxpB [Epidermidibacterium keratini]QHC00839.1 5-oxoprolinase subunit PxpB [Epidermidibacterium keratini]